MRSLAGVQIRGSLPLYLSTSHPGGGIEKSSWGSDSCSEGETIVFESRGGCAANKGDSETAEEGADAEGLERRLTRFDQANTHDFPRYYRFPCQFG